MNNNPIQQILNSFISNSGSNITQTQQSYIDVIRSGDSVRGEQLATNLCNSMGLTREEAIKQARNFFHI